MFKVLFGAAALLIAGMTVLPTAASAGKCEAGCAKYCQGRTGGNATSCPTRCEASCRMKHPDW
jgi:hypothetical protein